MEPLDHTSDKTSLTGSRMSENIQSQVSSRKQSGSIHSHHLRPQQKVPVSPCWADTGLPSFLYEATASQYIVQRSRLGGCGASEGEAMRGNLQRPNDWIHILDPIQSQNWTSAKESFTEPVLSKVVLARPHHMEHLTKSFSPLRLRLKTHPAARRPPGKSGRKEGP
jgi:hypothetical protein